MQADKTAESMLEILQELTDIVGSRPIEAGELATMQQSTILSLPAMVQTAKGLRNSIESLLEHGHPLDYWSGHADLIRSLTLDRVNAAARQIIDPEKLVWIVAGDRELVEPAIRNAGFGPIQVIDAEGLDLYS